MKSNKTNENRGATVTMNRREAIKLGFLTGGSLLGSGMISIPFGSGGKGIPGLGPAKAWAAGEVYPVSPFILEPFIQALPIPKPMMPSNPRTWNRPVRDINGVPFDYTPPPLPGRAQSDGTPFQRYRRPAYYYRIPLIRAPHRFTSSKVQPIDSSGQDVIPPDGIPGPRVLPDNWMSLFNGAFPGPMIAARYGAPVLVREENLLAGWTGSGWSGSQDGADYGVPSHLTHLHNGHTSPESDGQPHYAPMGYDSYFVGDSMVPNYSDNLYLNWPPDNDDREKQSFLWFHDHRMDNTGTNVYAGLVGLYYLYDAMDAGDERRGYRLPSGPYDIPLAFYDCLFDDGVTPHNGEASGGFGSGDPMQTPPQDGQAHPERWGKAFGGHFSNQGFVGDVFTVNGVAYPVLHVKRRKYRFRFLECSISRWYEFSLRQGTLVEARGQQGQWQLAGGGQQCMRMVEIATDGGLIPRPIVRDHFQLANAKRREVIVDFTKYMDGSRVSIGDEIYLANTLEMPDGRKPSDPQPAGYAVPLLKFIVEGDPLAPDRSIIPARLRALPPVPRDLSNLPRRHVILQRGGGMWEIVDDQGRGGIFDPANPLITEKLGSAALWTVENGGGGWVHPLHIHMEEHHVVSRNGVPSPSDPLHIDDNSKEDVIALEPGESVVIYRKFRSFTGKYVCHCHNLAHEDHAMMFGWSIAP